MRLLATLSISVFLCIGLLSACDAQRDADHEKLVSLQSQIDATIRRQNELDATVESLKTDVEDLKEKVQEVEDNDDSASQEDVDRLKERVDRIANVLATW